MPRPVHLLATRKSPLALRQAEMAGMALAKAFPEIDWDILPMTTTGDERLKWSLEEKGGKGLFTRELELALLENRATLAIHSAKDLPTALPEGLTIAGYLPRADPRDVLVTRAERHSPELIATSSPRRRSQLAARFPHARWTTIRGNVQTRLRKIVEGQADGTLLAAAGLDRLGITPEAFPELRFERLAVEAMVPAPGQAAIAIQSRNAESATFGHAFCAATAYAVSIEKTFLAALGGGCQTPVGVHWSGGILHVHHPRCGTRAIPFTVPHGASPEPPILRLIDEWGLAEPPAPTTHA